MYAATTGPLSSIAPLPYIFSSLFKSSIFSNLNIVHPNININITNDLTSNLINDLKLGKLDFVIFNESNIKEMNLIQDEGNDSITILIELFEPVNELVGSSDKELTVQINNEGNTVEISVTNNYESEEDIYESRFNGRRTPYTHKWS